MQAPQALRLLRPLLARPAQLRAGGARLETTCDSPSCPPCPPCEPAKQPPCRGRPAEVITGKRVVCCPPPRGFRPPCNKVLPRCSLDCKSLQTEKPSPIKAEAKCGDKMDQVAELMREQQKRHREEYEAEVKERNVAPPAEWLKVDCKLSSSEGKSQSQVVATDGRSYSLMPDTPPPRSCSPPSCPPGTPRTPPEPELVELKRPACAPVGSNHCAHQPRTLVSIDRSPVPEPDCPDQTCTDMKQRSKSPEPCPLPKKPCDNRKGRGLKARILETLSRGRSTSSGGGGASGGGATCGHITRQARKVEDKEWCKNLPEPAPTPECCIKPTVQDYINRTPKPPCGPIGTRRLHTSAAKPPVDRDATIAADKKLQAALMDREKLNEAGRGRTVLPPVCEVPPPPPPKPTGGALELGVPLGADSVCVRVSVGSGGGAAPASPCVRAGPRSPAGAPHSPASPPGGGAASDSWLSIKSLQQKLSGRQPCAPKPAGSLCGPSSEPAKPKPLSHPAPGNPCAQPKMADIIPQTIFIKSS